MDAPRAPRRRPSVSPWFQQRFFTVIPALAAAVLLRPAIEGLLLRALTAAVLAGAVATVAALLTGQDEPLLSRGLALSLACGFVVALLAGWVATLRSE